MVNLNLRQHLLVADASPRVIVHFLHKLTDSGLAVPYHMAGYPLRRRNQSTIHHQHPVVEPCHVALDQNAPGLAPLPGLAEGCLHMIVFCQVDGDAPPVIGIQRLHHHRIANPVGPLHRFLLAVDQSLNRDRQPETAQKLVRLFLVAGDLNGDVPGFIRDCRLNPALILPMTKLDKTVIIQPDERDVPLSRRFYQ